MGSRVAPTKPSWWCLLAPQKHCLGLVALWRAKTGWPVAATVLQVGPRSLSTFFFDMDPGTNDGGPECYLQVSQIGRPMGAHQ